MMRQKTVLRMSRALTLMPACCLALPTMAWAQQTTMQAEDASTLEEVLVTASKRESTVQSTPMSISATTGEDILQQGIGSIADLALRTPGASMTSGGPGRTIFVIRGMSPTGGAAPTVGYYLNETPISPPSQSLNSAGKSMIDPSLYDLARVEVLRGPQGTLYGAGSMGGTIRLITNAPELDTWASSVQTILSDTHEGGTNYGANGMLNIPLGDRFAARVVGSYKYDDGFIDRKVVPDFPALDQRGEVRNASVSKVYEDQNNARTKAIRATVLGQLTDSFTVKPSVFHQKITQDGQNTIDLPPGDELAHYQPLDVAEGNSDEFTVYDLVATYQLPAFDIQSTTAYTSRRNRSLVDDTEPFYSLFGIGTYIPGPTLESYKSEEFTQELRATSTGDGPWQWIIGAFYSDFSVDLRYDIEVPEFESVFGTPIVFNLDSTDNLKQYAVFGELSYRLTQSLNVTVGLRYFDYDFNFRQASEGIIIPPVNARVSGTASRDGVNPKVTLAYAPAEESLYYVTAAKGFRPGAPNGPIPGNVPGAQCGDALAAIGLSAAPRSYGPDSVWSYELGAKFALFDRRMQINGAVYHLDWSDIQQSVPLPCGFSFTANVGEAKADGAELELTARLGGGVTFRQSVGYVDARITRQTIQATNVDQIEQVPEWTFNSALEYSRPLFADWELWARTNYQYTGETYDAGAAPYPLTHRPSFGVANAAIGLTRGQISGNLFVDNLTDERGIVGIFPTQAATIPSSTRVIPLRPRTIGLDLQWSFK